MPVHLPLLPLLGFVAGTVGSAIGIGGGLILIPILTLFFEVPIRQAIGTSMVCVIATSCGAGSRYLRQGLADIRLGLVLELGTTMGAVTGAFLAGLLSHQVLGVLFALLLIYASTSILRKRGAVSPR